MVFYQVLAKVTIMFMICNNRANHICKFIDHSIVHCFIQLSLESILYCHSLNHCAFDCSFYSSHFYWAIYLITQFWFSQSYYSSILKKIYFGISNKHQILTTVLGLKSFCLLELHLNSSQSIVLTICLFISHLYLCHGLVKKPRASKS